MLDDFYTAPIDKEKVSRLELGSSNWVDVRHASNKDFKREMQRLRRSHKRQMKKIDEEGGTKAQELLAPIVAKYLVSDWKMTASKDAAEKLLKGVKTKSIKDSENAVDVPYSNENVTAILKMSLFSNLFVDIYGFSLERESFEVDNLEDEIKN